MYDFDLSKMSLVYFREAAALSTPAPAPSRSSLLPWLVFWTAAFPAVFAPVLFLAAWPVRLRELEDMALSSVRAANEWRGTEARAGEEPEEAPLRSLRGRANAEDEDSTSDRSNAKDEDSNANLRRVARDVRTVTLDLFYRVPDGENVLTRARAMRQVERDLIPEAFCVPPSTGERIQYAAAGRNASRCGAMISSGVSSPVNYFFPTIVASSTVGVESVVLYDGKSSDPDPVAFEQVLADWLRARLADFLPRSFFETGAISSTRTRFTLESGDAPALIGFVRGDLLAAMQTRASEALQTHGVTVSWYSYDMLDAELAQAVTHDAFLAMGSAAVVAVVMFVLMDRSLFLCFFGMLSLFWAFPMAYAIFVGVLGFREMFTLSFVSLFVLFALGSDACFIILDEALRQAGADPARPKRFWVRGVRATFVPLSTTAVAFFANAASPVVVLKEFSIFVGLVAVCAFLTTSTIFSCAAQMYVERSERKPSRFRINHYFKTDVADAVGVRWRRRLLTFTSVFVVACAIMLVLGGFPTDTSQIPQFFDESQNIGRVLSVRESFDSVFSVPTSSAPGSGDGVVTCEAGFAWDGTKCAATASYSWTVRVSACPCDLPSSPLLEEYMVRLTKWSPASFVRVANRTACGTCFENSTATVIFSFASLTPSSSFPSLQTTLRNNVRVGDRLLGTFLVVFTSTSPTTKSPTSRSPSKSPTRRPAASPSSWRPTSARPTSSAPTTWFSPTSSSPSIAPSTTSPTLFRPTSRAPSTKVPTPRPTKATRSPREPPPNGFTEFPSVSPSRSPSFSPTRTSSPTLFPSTSPSLAPTSSNPTSRAPTSSNPTSQRPSSFPSTSPSQRPSTNPTDSPSTSVPTRPPTTNRPTSAPFSTCTPERCSNRGVCNPVTLSCTCDLGSTGSNCSETVDAEIPDGFAAEAFSSLGLVRGSADWDSSFDAFALQERLLAYCASLCAWEEVANDPASACFASQALRTFNYSSLTLWLPGLGRMTSDRKKRLAMRRLEECPFADFVWYLRARNVPFPVQNRTQFRSWVQSFLGENSHLSESMRADRAGNLRLVRARLLTALSSQQTDLLVAEDVDSSWQEFARIASQDVGHDVLVVSELFSTSATQLALLRGFTLSLIVTCVVAVAVVALHLRSVLVTAYVAAYVVCVVVCVFWFCFFVLKWPFGVIEAVELCVVIGVGVDFGAHLAFAWVHSSASDRAGKLADAMHRVGFALVSSCSTTVGACSLMFFARVVPFRKFGFVLSLTSMFALLFTFVFLAGLLVAGGDERACRSRAGSVLSLGRAKLVSSGP